MAWKETLQNFFQGVLLQCEKSLATDLTGFKNLSGVGITQDLFHNVLVDNNNWVEVSVTDTGVGISKENQQKLFQADKFITGTSITPDKVSGLGLLICKEAAKKHNGQIWVESELGQGTTITFTIPSVSSQ